MATTRNLIPHTARPADEWASSTSLNGVLNVQKPTTLQDMGSPFPGPFSEELVPQQQNSDSTLLDTANGKTYLPTPDDVQHAVTSVGQAAKTYLPPSLAAYLPSASFLNLETDPDLAPPTLARNFPLRVDSLSSSSAAASASDADSGNLSTVVHTGSTASPHPVPPLSPADSHTIIRGVPLCLRPAQSEGPPVPQNSLVTPSPGVSTSAPTCTPSPTA
ncbi:hypothetical protein B0H14DRAFT_3733856 [Mycena olivaceomarginata]|nr:hypothetical protein B0H14DRAFT_3733856 [Mycena olivaceomarginata]